MDDEIHVEKPTGRDGIIVPFLMQFHGSLNDTWGMRKGVVSPTGWGPAGPQLNSMVYARYNYS